MYKEELALILLKLSKKSKRKNSSLRMSSYALTEASAQFEQKIIELEADCCLWHFCISERHAGKQWKGVLDHSARGTICLQGERTDQQAGPSFPRRAFGPGLEWVVDLGVGSQDVIQAWPLIRGLGWNLLLKIYW